MLNGLVQIGTDTVRVENQKFSSAVKPAVAGAIPAADYQPGSSTQGTPAAQTSSVGAPSFVLLAKKAPKSTATTASEASCDVLYLDIQPIHLDLLGLDLQTSRITLDLKGIPGPGNLLGNLVCDLAHLLDGTPDAISQITDQLNQVLSGAGVAAAAASTSVATEAPTVQSGNSTTTEVTAPSVSTEVPAAATPVS